MNSRGKQAYSDHSNPLSVVVITIVTVIVPMDCSPPGSSVYGISQARVLDVLPFPSPGDLLDLRIESTSPALVGEFFTTEPPGKPLYINISYLYKN